MKKGTASNGGSGRSPAPAKKPPSPASQGDSVQIKKFAEVVQQEGASLNEIMNSPRYQEQIKQWVEDNSSNPSILMKRSEVVQWLFQNERLAENEWLFLVKEIVAGRHRDLLVSETGLYVLLWNKLCQYLVENPENLRTCLAEKDILLGFFTHASLRQRVLCFENADAQLMSAIFSLCSDSVPFRHCLYSVLNDCFALIRNEVFYQSLLRARPFFLEYAITVTSAENLDAFEREFQSKEWFGQFEHCKAALLKKKSVAKTGDRRFTEEDQSRIERYLRSIIKDFSEQSEISEEAIISYFGMDNPNIHLALFANPLLAQKLIDLNNAQKITIDIQDHIFPLMRWMIAISKKEQSISASNHLINSGEMTHYFIAAIERLFALPQTDSNKILLAEFFELFGSTYFSGVSTEQLAVLQRIRGNDEVIFGRFQEACPAKAQCYRVLGGVKGTDIYGRWKATHNRPAQFIEEFKYKSASDIDRWMKLLLCEWKQDLGEKAIVDLIVEHAEQLCFADFLRAIKGTPSINQLFLRRIQIEGKQRPYLAGKIVGIPEIAARCGFTLEDFKNWKPNFLMGVLSKSKWHKPYGFTPSDFYRLISNDHGNTLFALDEGREGFLDRLLTHPDMSEKQNARTRLFLLNTFLGAPTEIQSVFQQWLGARIRKYLLGAVVQRAGLQKVTLAQLPSLLKAKKNIRPDLILLATLHLYLTNPEFCVDFLTVLRKDITLAKLIKDILSGASPCVRDFFYQELPLEEDNLMEPWRAHGAPHKEYKFNEQFKPVHEELKKLALRLQNSKTETEKQRYVTLMWQQNCEFILTMLRDQLFLARLVDLSKQLDYGADDLKELKALRNWSEVCNALNTNNLARKIGLMFNPGWLGRALAYFTQGDYDGHVEFVGTYLQLPGFVPTTKDLHPCHLKNTGVNSLLQNMVKKRPRSMVEYLISLCLYDIENEDKTVQEFAVALVDIGIECYFKNLFGHGKNDSESGIRSRERFICLCVRASRFLSLTHWDKQFEINEGLLSFLCKWLSDYDMIELPAAVVPDFVRMQLIVLRKLSENLVLPSQPTEDQVMAKQRAQTAVNQIFWQLSCIPVEARRNIQVQDCFDEQVLQRLDYLDVRNNLAHLISDTVKPVERSRVQEEQRSGSTSPRN